MCSCGICRVAVIVAAMTVGFVIGLVTGLAVRGDMMPVAGSHSGSAEVTRRVVVSEESTVATRAAWGPSIAVGRPKTPDGEEESPGGIERISLDGFACRLSGPSLTCYSPVQRRCVVLAKGRNVKPDTVIAKRGGPVGLPICRGYDIFVEY